jgi:hypothetical protein
MATAKCHVSYSYSLLVKGLLSGRKNAVRRSFTGMNRTAQGTAQEIILRTLKRNVTIYKSKLARGGEIAEH